MEPSLIAYSFLLTQMKYPTNGSPPSKSANGFDDSLIVVCYKPSGKGFY